MVLEVVHYCKCLEVLLTRAETHPFTCQLPPKRSVLPIGSYPDMRSKFWGLSWGQPLPTASLLYGDCDYDCNVFHTVKYGAIVIGLTLSAHEQPNNS